MKKIRRKYCLSLLLVTVWGLALAYSFGDAPFAFDGHELRQTQWFPAPELPPDTLTAAPTATAADTSHHVILFFGDSMVEGLHFRFRQYAAANHFDLCTVVWYGSSTQLWAETDTLEHFIRRFRPTYVVLSLGSNELFLKDLRKQETYVDRILRKIGGRPYCWIGPPNWKRDTGINRLIRRKTGSQRFFESSRLSLERRKDGAHPTRQAAARWMDSVAVWMESPLCDHPLQMKPPNGKDTKATLVLLSPP